MSFDATIFANVIIALFGGGTIMAIVKSFIEKRKINAEADSTSVKSLLEIDQRMNERMTKLEERVANLEQENYKLKMEKLDLEKQSHGLKRKIKELEEQNGELNKTIKSLKEENDGLKRRLPQ